jgi:type IV pilus assembly protein PilQ
MWKWTRIIGLVCTVAMAVYSGRANPLDAAASSDHPASTKAESERGVLVQRPRLTLPTDNAILAEAIDPPTNSDTAPQDSAEPAAPHTGVSMTSNQVSISDAGNIEMHVSDAGLLEVLRMLSLKSQRNIIASKSVDGRVTANLYNVTIREALDAILQSNGYVYREKGNFIFVYSAKELADQEKASRVMSTEVFHLYYTPAANAASMIKPVLSTESQVAVTTAAQSGIDLSGTGDTGGNSHATEDMLVVTDYTENLEKARKIIKEVDRRPQEILVEATILAATLSDNNSMGVDFSVMGGVKFNQFLSTPTQTITNAAAGNLQSSTNGPGVGQYGVGQTSFTNQLPAGGLRVGLLTNNISLFVQALESVTNTTVLANPKVLSLDKQKGYVHVGRSDGYQTTTVSQTTSTQTVQFLDSGTTLAFRPYIGDDGYVRMEIHPEDSSGGLTSANLPYKTTTEVTANLMVKDGHTIVIGGLFRDTSSASRGQVPFLGNIPLLGVLFRQQQDQSQRQEIIILLTPHIIKDDSAYAKISETDMKRVEELRVGVRKGMMIFGRERLAECAYENAVAEESKPNPDMNLVLWHLNIATDLNPTFLEAIEMKEKISGKQVTDVDNSSIRSFVARAIADDTAPPATENRKTGTDPVSIPRKTGTDPVSMPTPKNAIENGVSSSPSAKAMPTTNSSPAAAGTQPASTQAGQAGVK